MTDLHDFENRVWVKDRLSIFRRRNSWKFDGGQIVASLPANTFLPLITGIPTVGQTLTTTTGTWTQSPSVFLFQWLRNGSPIAGATGQSYTLGMADLGDMVTVAVEATNQVGTSSPVDAKPVGPIAAVLAISGTPVTSATAGQPYAGFTVSATGGWTPYLFNVVSGLLPPGITLDARTGKVSGTPLGGGNYPGIVIQVTDRYGETANLPAFTIAVTGQDSLDFSKKMNSQYLGFV